jgi:hypothetical protein
MQSIVGRITAAGFLLFILILATPWTGSLVLGTHELGRGSEQLSYSFSFPTPLLSTGTYADAMFTKINLPGCLGLGRQPGDPILPVKFIQLRLPPRSTLGSVTVTGSLVDITHNGINLTENYPYPAPEETPLGAVASSELLMNQEVYSSNQLYPGQPYNDYHIGYSHGYTIFDIGLQPVQLIPADGRIFYYPELTVTITLQKDGASNPFYRGTAEDEAWVKNLVYNPEMITRYSNLSAFEYSGGLCDPSDHFDYVIITTTQNSLDHWDITHETPYNWESLMNQHMSEGLTCTLVTVQDINTCPDYWNTSYSLFNDSQAHIREFCKDAYEDWGTQYILIAGDADTIPARQLYYAYEGNVDSDVYWSNLDKTFNDDHDAYWGEEGDTGFDPYSELFIGRVPCDTPQDVSNWLTKCLTYTESTDPDYLENAGFYDGNLGWPGYEPGGLIIDFAAINGTDHWYGSDPGPWPEFLGFLYGFSTWNLVHPDDAFNLSVRRTSGYPPNPGWNYAEDATVPFRNAINNDSVTLITGIGHADSQMSLDVFKTDWETRYHNHKPFFICDLGCHCGDFNDGDDGVLDTMLFSSNTTLAFGCLYNTGYSWGSFDSTNASDPLQTKLFWDYFFDLENNSQSIANWQFGKGLAWSKDMMAPTLNWSDYTGSWRGTIEDRLLFADPAQLFKPPHPLNPNHPPNPPHINWSDLGLTLVTTDPDGEAIYYQIDWGDGSTSDWLGPYPSGDEITVMHTWIQPGTYIVRAQAKDIHDAVSDWSDPIQVVISQPQLTIKSIQGPLGISVKMANTGNENLSQIRWNISLTGGHVLIGAYKSGLFASLPIDTSVTMQDFILGLGKTTITVNAVCAEGATSTKTMNGFLLGVFVIPLK